MRSVGVGFEVGVNLDSGVYRCWNPGHRRGVFGSGACEEDREEQTFHGRTGYSERVLHLCQALRFE